MNPCTNHERLIQEYIEGALDGAGQEALREHLKDCPVCREAFGQVQLLEEWVKDAFEPASGADAAADRILERIRDGAALREVGGNRRRAWWPGRWVPALAALGCLMLGLAAGLWGGRMSARPAGAALQEGTAVQIRVARLEGTVLVRHAGADQWAPLKTASPLFTGDLILCSAQSSLELRLKDNSTLMLEPNSIFHLSHYNGSADFALDRGALVADLNSPHPPFVVRTPNGAIQALGTKFRVKVK